MKLAKISKIIRLHQGSSLTINNQKGQFELRNHGKTATSTDNDFIQAKEEKQVTNNTHLTENLKVVKAAANQRENDIYTCQYCTKTFQKMHNLKIHVKLHTTARPFDCVVCKRTFKTKRCLKSHMICHADVKPYSCTICEKRFGSKKNLSTHTLIHTGVKRHVCKICLKAFTQSGQLTVHLLKHSTERTHACTICRKMFKCKRDLKAHTKSHSKDIILKCDTCGLRYQTQQALQDHVRLRMRPKILRKVIQLHWLVICPRHLLFTLNVKLKMTLQKKIIKNRKTILI